MPFCPVLVVLVFIALDVVTGIAKAFATTGFDSSIMRQGFFHKLGEIFAVSLSMIADIGLPDISGIDATKQILEHNNNIRVIMLTSHISENELNASLTAGASAYVIKDISTDFLMSVIKMVKEGAMWIDPHVVPFIRDKNSGVIPSRQLSRSAFKENHSNLTQREYEVLKLVVDGQSNSQIAQTLTISEHTAKAHVCNIIQKLVVDDRTQAAVKALKEGLV